VTSTTASTERRVLDSPEDAQRRRDLRRMKAMATGLLVLAAIVFVVARWVEEDQHWAGYVRATAEAAMVGAIADWFAVTALFKHPLGLPIPHTAIVKKRKDQIGESLGGFVRDNFLTREVVGERLEQAELGRRVGGWLAEPENARAIGDQSAAVVRGVTEVLRDDVVQSGLEQAITNRVKSMPVAPLVGRAVDVATEGDHHQILLESTLSGLATFLDENQLVFRERLATESPWWVPEPIDDRVFEKIYLAISRFIADVGGDRDHELRQQLDRRTLELAERLKESDELRDRGETIKAELLDHPEVRRWFDSLWSRVKLALLEAADDPMSPFREQLEEALVQAGASIERDPELQAKIDGWIVGATGYVAEQFRGEVADLIAHTVQRWDTDETSDRIELQVGRDLQFIRINGTVVGGLAGLLIYTLSELVF
jgi:uncharacterized membrane-anchored protein YjiN (DUF445 family)